MADNTPTPAVTPEPVAVVAPTPVVETPVAAAPVVEAPKVETPVVETPKPVETLLGEQVKVETPKQPEEPKQEAPKVEEPTKIEQQVAEEAAKQNTASPEATNTDGGQTAEPAPPPSYEPFTLPEGITLDQERVGKFTEILAELETGGKVPHELVQAFGQKAVDFHIGEINRVVEDYNKALQDGWQKQKNDWKELVTKDPDMGGNRLQATINAANNFIETHGGTKEQITAFRNLMESSGLGNHPDVIRMFANAGRAMAEGRPLAAPKPVAPAPKSRTKTLYGN